MKPDFYKNSSNQETVMTLDVFQNLKAEKIYKLLEEQKKRNKQKMKRIKS